MDESDAPALLAAYCAHVCLMAVNGVAEAFVNATASAEELTALSRAMVAFAAAYLLLAAAALRLAGSMGLVLANCLNMAARALYAYSYLRGHVARAVSLAARSGAPLTTAGVRRAALSSADSKRAPA